MDKANDIPILSAREFRLVDDQGNVRAKLALDEENCPGLSLFDRDSQTPAVSLRVDNEGDTGLTIWDRSGSIAAELINEEDGSAVILYDRQDRVRLVLSAATDAGGAPSIWLAHSASGRDRFRITLDPLDGLPYIEVNDDNPGKSLFELNVDSEGSLHVQLRHKPGTSIWPPQDPEI